MKNTFLFLALLSVVSVLRAQDPLFLNTNQSLVSLNPSFAGSNGFVRNQFLLYNRWPNSSNYKLTYYNGMDAYVKPLHGGLAISALTTHMYEGNYRSSELNLVYAPHFECKENGLKIIPSFQLGVRQRYLNISNLHYTQFESLIDMSQMNESISSTKKTSFSGSLGLLVNYKRFYAGASVFHFNQPDIGLIGMVQLPRRFNLNASYNLEINNKTLINFSTLYSQQGRFRMMSLMVNAIIFKYVLVGTGYAMHDIFILNMGYQSKFFTVTYGYEFFHKQVTNRRSGGNQLTLALSLNKRERKTIPAAFEKW